MIKMIIRNIYLLVATVILTGCSGMLDIPGLFPVSQTSCPNIVVTPNKNTNSGVRISIIEGTGSTSSTPHSGTFTVYLSSDPGTPVTYNITSSDSTHATVSPSALSFNSSDYSTPKTVTVTASTATGNGNKNVDILVGSVSLPCVTAAFAVLDPLSPNFIVSNLSNPTDTTGVQATFGVFITTAPAGNVFIPIKLNWDSNNSTGQQGVIDLTNGTSYYNSDGTAYSSGTPYLKFTAANLSQTVRITGIDDNIYTSGNVQYYIQAGGPTSSDSNYSALASQYVTVNNLEKHAKGFYASKTNGMATDTQGNLGSTYANFNIHLLSKPTSTVTLTFTSSYGTITTSDGATNTLTFTSSNYSTDKTVFVVGNSSGVGHSGTYSVTTTVATSDPTYNSATLCPRPSFSIYNCDNTTNPIAICWLSGTSQNTTQSGGSLTFYLITKDQPSSDISVSFTSDNTIYGGTITTPVPSAGTGTVTINSTNWKQLLSSNANAITITGAAQALTTANYFTGGIFKSSISYHAVFQVSAGGVTYTLPQLSINNNTDIPLFTAASLSPSTDQGGIGQFSIKMNYQPAGSSSVSITISPSSGIPATAFATGLSLTNSSASMTSSLTLTFNDINYNTLQNVYIEGDTFAGVRGDKTSAIKYAAISGSSDTNLNGYTPPNANAVTCQEVNKLIWVTNNTYDGNFNSFTTVDSESLASANDTNRPTLISGATYKALIADDTNRVATGGIGKTDWPLLSNKTYYLHTGTAPYTTAVLTTDSSGLFSSLSAPFTSSSSDNFWTGLNSDLTTATGYTCGSWDSDTVSSQTAKGQYGAGGSTTSTAWSSGNKVHTGKSKIIFVQQ